MSGLMPPNVLSYEGQVVVPFISRGFAPLTSNFQFNVPTFWIDSVHQTAYILVAKPGNVAVWLPITNGPSTLIGLTGDDGSQVVATSGNINIFGRTVANSTNAKPLFTIKNATSEMDIEIQVASAQGSSNINKGGIASFSSSQFSVDSNGFVTLIGSGATVTQFGVDANTAPGTNPVLPDGTGKVTITGGQVAAGTTTNVIRTDSLAANTYTVQIQRSQAVGSSTVGDNGVSHFDSSRFTVDSNGFVSVNGSGLGETITGDTGGALSPSSGNWNIIGGTGVSTAGSGSTLTINSTGGGFTWVDVTGTSASMAVNHGYLADNAGLVTLTLPATAAQFSAIAVAGHGAGGWTIAQNANQQVLFGSSATTVGVGGSLSSTNANDTVFLLASVGGANTIWTVLSSIGNITVV